MSYFLWRSTPDDSLLKAASEKRLRDPKELRAQAERLLNDPRSARFVSDFTDQWLGLRDIGFTQPDPDLYPEYDMNWYLADSLVQEPRAYFAEMLKQNLGVRYVVDSNFTFANAPLAKLYGVPNIEGVPHRMVMLPKDSVRGGFVTQAASLKVTANGTTTSPVVRGAWVLDRILGQPAPPPPPNIPAIEPDIRGATTVRAIARQTPLGLRVCAGATRRSIRPASRWKAST